MTTIAESNHIAISALDHEIEKRESEVRALDVARRILVAKDAAEFRAALEVRMLLESDDVQGGDR
jgi:hypothetical protein